MKIVFVTVEKLDSAGVLSGGALRVLGMMHMFDSLGLQTKAICVVSSQGLEDLLKKEKADILVFEQWHLLENVGQLDPVIVLDLHGSLLFENFYKNHLDPEQIGAKLLAFSRVDYLFVPGERQYWYFFAWARMTGLNLDDGRILKVPLVMNPKLYEHVDFSSCNENLLVCGGGVWPWIQDNFSKEKFHEYGFDIQTFQWKTPDQGVSHRELVSIYSSALAAMDLFLPNSERKLAITTRTIDYLYCKIPVIYPEGMELSDWIEENNFGVVVPLTTEFDFSFLREKLVKSREHLRKTGVHASLYTEAKKVLSNFLSLCCKSSLRFGFQDLERERRELGRQNYVLKRQIKDTEVSLAIYDGVSMEAKRLERFYLKKRIEELEKEVSFWKDLWEGDVHRAWKRKS